MLWANTVWSTRAYYQAMSVGTFDGVSGVHFWGVTRGERYEVSLAVPPNTWVHTAWVRMEISSVAT